MTVETSRIMKQAEAKLIQFRTVTEEACTGCKGGQVKVSHRSKVVEQLLTKKHSFDVESLDEDADLKINKNKEKEK
jgi:hypothetical protein